MENQHPVITSFLDFFFPKKCLSCGNNGNYFCPDCKGDLPYIEHFICSGCFNPSLTGKTHVHCMKKTSLDGIVFSFHYKGVIKQAIKKIKYRGVFSINDDLVDEALQLLDITQFQGFILIPVPLHRKRFNIRGFNQSELIAKRISKKWNMSCNVESLERIRNTEPQAKLNKKERVKNLKNAFRVKDKKMVKDKNFLLIDDVFTSGATLNECAKTLKKSGADKVWAFTIAHGS